MFLTHFAFALTAMLLIKYVSSSRLSAAGPSADGSANSTMSGGSISSREKRVDKDLSTADELKFAVKKFEELLKIFQQQVQMQSAEGHGHPDVASFHPPGHQL